MLDKVRSLGHEVIDFGAASEEPVDYPDVIAPAAHALARGEVERAIVVCGSGVGASVIANRFPGVRCALVTDLYIAEMSRRHNDSNCLSLRTREQSPDLNDRIIETWLKTPFDGGRHERRINRIDSVVREILEKDKK